MAHRLLRDPEADGWERSDMPIVCESCLGPNPFVRMQRIEYGGLCHISNRPYTVFRWKPGTDARYKKTIICQEVAKAKNVCQVCLLDLEYNLPVQVRDTALGLTNDDEPQSDVGKEFQLHQRVKEGENGSSFNESRPNDMLLRLQRTTPYYKRNEAKVCTFFAKGQCTRGAECPYRHEMPTVGELANQNIKDRYYGINDPVANKMMRRLGDMPKLEPPEDKSIMTLFVGGVTPEMTEDDIRDHFYAFGELVSIRRVPAKNCAFVTYSTRGAAEKAVAELYGKLIIKGQRLRISWGKPHQPAGDHGAGAAGGGGGGTAAGAASYQQPAAASGYGGGYSLGYGAPPPGVSPAMLYPSMAKDQMGTRNVGGKRPAEEEEDGSAGDAGKRPRPPPGVGPPAPGGHYAPAAAQQAPQAYGWGGAGYGQAAGYGLAPPAGAAPGPSAGPQ